MGMLLSWALSKYSRERLDPVELRLVGAPSIASSSPSMLQAVLATIALWRCSLGRPPLRFPARQPT
jgi:hypothetical protein